MEAERMKHGIRHARGANQEFPGLVPDASLVPVESNQSLETYAEQMQAASGPVADRTLGRDYAARQD
jgi:hypothetical protein